MSEAAPSGILVVDKARGFTSMDVCAIVRGRLRKGGAPRSIKVGHAGTLDPLATGVLVVLVGKATRACERLMAGEKEYEAEIDLAHRSTTDDAEGTITPVPVATPPAREAVESAARGLTGPILQVPPAFSAIKVGGRRAYAEARRGREVALAPRPVVVHEFEITGYAFPIVRARIRCGKGTYVRSLARDLGVALGTGGMLASLRRTRVGAFTIAMARPLDDLPSPLAASDLAPLPEA